MSKFQKMHYEMIAEHINTYGDIDAETLCKMFSADNHRFNRTKFLIACGVKP